MSSVSSWITVSSWHSFSLGALSAFGLVILSRFVSARRIRAKRLEAPNASLPHQGDDHHVTIWGFDAMPNAVRVSDGSPYVARVELFCKMTGIEYVKKEAKFPLPNPRGKVPYANIRGVMVDDSSLIIKHLRNAFTDPDAHLSEKQKATRQLIWNTLSGSLYWVGLYNAFGTEDGREVIRRNLRKKIGFFGGIAAKFAIDSQQEILWQQGTMRLPQRDVQRRATDDLQALSAILGDQANFLGTPNFTSIDADAAAFLTNLFYGGTQGQIHSWIHDAMRNVQNLVDFVDRFEKHINKAK